MAAVEELAYLSNQLAFEREAPRTWSKADFTGTTKRCNGASALGSSLPMRPWALTTNGSERPFQCWSASGGSWSAGLATGPSWT